MRNLGAVGNGGVFGLHKVADAAMLPDGCARADIGIGAHLGARTHPAFQHHAVLHGCAVLHHAVLDPRTLIERAARADFRVSLQDHAGIDHAVLSHGNIRIDICIGRVDERRAAQHDPFVDAGAENSRNPRQMRPVVDAFALFQIGQDNTARLFPLFIEDIDAVREIIFALGIVGGQLAERLQKRLGAEAIEGYVDLFDFLLLRAGVLFLHDAADIARRIPDNPAIACRVLQNTREQKGVEPALFRLIRQHADGFAPHQRHIPRENHGIIAPPQQILRHHDGMAGALAFRLKRIFAAVPQGLGNCVAARAIDHNGFAREGFLRRADHPFHQRPPRRLMQNLGRLRFHPRAVACRQYHCSIHFSYPLLTYFIFWYISLKAMRPFSANPWAPEYGFPARLMTLTGMPGPLLCARFLSPGRGIKNRHHSIIKAQNTGCLLKNQACNMDCRPFSAIFPVRSSMGSSRGFRLFRPP